MFHEEQLICKENTPRIETPRLILRRFEERDEQAILRIFGNGTVNTFLPMFLLKNTEEAREYLYKRYLSFYEEEAVGWRYAVCLREDDVPFGYVGIGEGESHDTGWGMLPDFWGHGYITEAARAMVDRAKTDGLPFLTATHDRNNPRSGRVMQRLGMTYCYSYVEQWQPKDFPVVFRMYQLNLNGQHPVYGKYKEMYPENFVETPDPAEQVNAFPLDKIRLYGRMER